MVQRGMDENGLLRTRRPARDPEASAVPRVRPCLPRLAAALVLLTGASLFLAPRSIAQPSGPGASLPAIPVSTTKSERQDVPVWLRGLGTVQALNTVTVRARVDGTLDKFPVTEGQLVKQGTLLAVIDPRPYQAALDAAVAKKAQDDAQLAKARSSYFSWPRSVWAVA